MIIKRKTFRYLQKYFAFLLKYFYLLNSFTNYLEILNGSVWYQGAFPHMVKNIFLNFLKIIPL